MISLQTPSEKCRILRRTERDNIPVILARTLKFSHHIFEKRPTSNWTKILPVRAEIFHAEKGRADRHGVGKDGRTEMTKSLVDFHNFVKAPEKWLTYYFCFPVTSNPLTLVPFIESASIFNVLKKTYSQRQSVKQFYGNKSWVSYTKSYV